MCLRCLDFIFCLMPILYDLYSMTSMQNPSSDVNNNMLRFFASNRAVYNNHECIDTENYKPFQNENVNDTILTQIASRNLKRCIYANSFKFDKRISRLRKFFMLQVNIRSLQKHFDSLNEVLQDLPILLQIIGISETRIKKLPLINISLCPIVPFFMLIPLCPQEGLVLYLYC